jgi:cell fate regulator YaaT (PSP1 superfamily)
MQETVANIPAAAECLRLVPIKFRPAGRHYDFNAAALDLQPGDKVIVETDRGRALGTVVLSPREVSRAEAPEDLKKVLRLATEEDLSLAAVHTAREAEAFRFCLQRIQERKMPMKLVRAEYLFDGSKIIFYFTADGRVDFRDLVKDLAHYFHTRIEMRQIGVRDEAKLIGGLGVCGRELCCCTFLSEFAPVSVKMAKEQGLALNPSKISGQCGRLLCCLAYEFDTYCELKKCLPKCGRKVQFEHREGEVIDQNVLAQRVTLRFGDGKTAEVPAAGLEPARAEAAPAQRGRIPGGDEPAAGSPPSRPPRPLHSAPQMQSEASAAAAPPAPEAPAADQAPRGEGKRRRSRRRSKKK